MICHTRKQWSPAHTVSISPSLILTLTHTHVHMLCVRTPTVTHTCSHTHILCAHTHIHTVTHTHVHTHKHAHTQVSKSKNVHRHRGTVWDRSVFLFNHNHNQSICMAQIHNTHTEVPSETGQSFRLTIIIINQYSWRKSTTHTHTHRDAHTHTRTHTNSIHISTAPACACGGSEASFCLRAGAGTAPCRPEPLCSPAWRGRSSPSGPAQSRSEKERCFTSCAQSTAKGHHIRDKTNRSATTTKILIHTFHCWGPEEFGGKKKMNESGI